MRAPRLRHAPTLKNHTEKRNKPMKTIIVLIFSFLAFKVVTVNSDFDSDVELVRVTVPETTEDEIALIREYKSKNQPNWTPDGIYATEIKKYWFTLTYKYIFEEDGRIIKKQRLKGIFKDYSFTATANYTFEGSVLMPTNIEGDIGLFQPAGEPMTLGAHTLLVFDSDQPINLTKL